MNTIICYIGRVSESIVRRFVRNTALRVEMARADDRPLSAAELKDVLYTDEKEHTYAKHRLVSDVAAELGLRTIIPPVKCPVKFAGCGYVEGRTRAMKLGRHTHLVEGDDDMGFTEFVLLVDHLPSLSLTFYGSSFRVVVLDGGRTIYRVLYADPVAWDDIPEPIKVLLSPVFSSIRRYAERSREARQRVSQSVNSAINSVSSAD